MSIHITDIHAREILDSRGTHDPRFNVVNGGAHAPGAPARGERVAKYNRLTEIEDCTLMRFGLRAA